MFSKKLASAVAFVMLVSPCYSAIAQNAAAGQIIFKRCAVCHSTNGSLSVGPPLNGLIGRRAGAVPKYSYSKAMSAKPIVWDRGTLDKFLAKPQSVTPGTKMGFAGLPSATDRQDVIAYLATLKK